MPNLPPTHPLRIAERRIIVAAMDYSAALNDPDRARYALANIIQAVADRNDIEINTIYPPTPPRRQRTSQGFHAG